MMIEMRATIGRAKWAYSSHSKVVLYLQFLQFCWNCGLSPSVLVFSSSLISSPSSVGTETLWCEAAAEATKHASAGTIATNCYGRLNAVATNASDLADTSG